MPEGSNYEIAKAMGASLVMQSAQDVVISVQMIPAIYSTEKQEIKLRNTAQWGLEYTKSSNAFAFPRRL